MRNRSKRVFRTTYRMNKHRLKTGFDLVVVLSRYFDGNEADRLERDFLKLGERLGFLE